jgi:hypothetical protein
MLFFMLLLAKKMSLLHKGGKYVNNVLYFEVSPHISPFLIEVSCLVSKG